MSMKAIALFAIKLLLFIRLDSACYKRTVRNKIVRRFFRLGPSIVLLASSQEGLRRSR